MPIECIFITGWQIKKERSTTRNNFRLIVYSRLVNIKITPTNSLNSSPAAPNHHDFLPFVLPVNYHLRHVRYEKEQTLTKTMAMPQFMMEKVYNNKTPPQKYIINI